MVLYDNQGVIHLAKDCAFHKRTNQIEMHQWTRNQKCCVADDGSDMLTKALAREKPEICSEM